MPTQILSQPQILSPHSAVKTAPNIKKGFLKSAFAGAVLTATARIAFSAAVRSVTGGGIAIAALTVGAWGVGAEVARDYRAARKSSIAAGAPIKRMAAFRSVWTRDNNVKYAKKFGMRFVAGLIGAEIGAAVSHVIASHAGAIGDALNPVWQPVKTFAGHAKDAIVSHLPGAAVPAPVFHPAAVPLHDLIQPVPPPVVDLPPPPLPTPMEQLADLAHHGHLTKDARYTLSQALKGKSWAQNQAIDGLLNNRFGFHRNVDLAVQLTKQLAAHGDHEGMVKLAYMQNNSKFAALGVDYDPRAAMATMKHLHRAWPSPMDHFHQAASTTADSAPVALACNAVQNAANDVPGYITACETPGAGFVEGGKVNLNVLFNDGQKKLYSFVLGAEPASFLPGGLESTLQQATLEHAGL